MQPQNLALSPRAAALPLSLAALRPADVGAVCDALDLPTPTPDVTLDGLVFSAGLTLPDVYARLSAATDVRAMIAAAAMRGVTTLPRDSRLGPAPYPLSPNVRALLPETGSAPTPIRRRGAAPSETAALERRLGSPRPAASSRSAASAVSTCSPDAVLLTLSPCPSAPGSKRAERHALLTVGSTRAELRAAGVRDRDLERLVAGGHATFGPRPA